MSRRMKYRAGGWVAACLAAWLIGCVGVCGATEVQQFPFYPAPVYSNWPAWPTGWTALAGLSDSDDLADSGPNNDNHLDFVGDTTNAGAYWAQDNKYIYFRVRMDVDTVITHATVPNDTDNTYRDTVHVLIDRVGWVATTGQSADLPDFGFTWDSKEDYPNHGLEMTKLGTSNVATWGKVQMDDVDGSNSQKGAADFNGNNRTTDGYIRTIDGQSTTSFGNTTFIDFAISWNYLTQYSTTGLAPGQTWRIALASIADSNDHNLLKTDIAGGASPSTSPSNSVSVGWSGPITTQQVPEPSSLVVLGAVVLSGYVGCRLRRKKQDPQASANASPTGTR